MTTHHGDPERWRSIRAILSDLDGTIYLGGRCFPWSHEFIDAVHDTGRRIIYFTNNSSRGGESYVQKLSGMGISISRDDILTSTDATVTYLLEHHAGARLLLVGTRDFEAEIEAAGFEHVRHEDDRPDVVVVAFDTELTYDKLRAACRSIDRGAAFIATHPDFVCPDPAGPIPDCGAMCALITAATRAEPVVVGKPHRHMVDAATRRLGVEARECAIVGDRLYTDIRMGLDHGLLSVLVLSGETTTGMLADSEWQPDIVVPDVGALAEVLRGFPPPG